MPRHDLDSLLGASFGASTNTSKPSLDSILGGGFDAPAQPQQVAQPQAAQPQQVQQPQQMTQEQVEQPQDLSFMQRAGDVFTGNLRETPEMTGQGMPNQGRGDFVDQEGNVTGQGKAMVNDMSILGGQANQAKFALATTNMFNADEMAKVAVGINPDLEVRHNKDAQGNIYPILTNTKTGVNSMINLPGIDPTDVVKGVTSGVIFARTGGIGQGAQRMLSGASRAGGLQALSEIKDELVGGDFNAGEIGMAAAFGGIGEAIPMVASAIIRKIRGVGKAESVIGASRKRGQGKAWEMTTAQRAKVNNLKEGYDSSNANLSLAEKTEQMKHALASGDESRVAAMLEIDEDYVKALETLEIKSEPLVSHASQDIQVQQVEQGLKAVAGSQLAKNEALHIAEIQQKATDLLGKWGGGLERAGLDEKLLEETQTVIKQQFDKAEVVYDKINKAIPSDTLAPMENLTKHLNSKLKGFRGNKGDLSKLENKLLAMTQKVEKPVTKMGITSEPTSGPTYAALDNIRKEIGASIGKFTGAYTKEDQSKLKKLYGIITEDQAVVAIAKGAGKDWDTAKTLVKDRKLLEDNSVQMFGKDLNNAFMRKMGVATVALKKAEYKEFDKLMAAVPDESKQEVMVTALKSAFTNPGTKEVQFSMPHFANWHKNLQINPKLKARVYKHLPEGAGKELDALGKVSDNIRNAVGEKARGGAVLAVPGVMNGIVNGISKKVLVGFVGKIPGFGIVGDMVEAGLKKGSEKGSENAINMLSNPAFIGSIKAQAQGQAKKATALERKFMKTQAFKGWMSELSKQEKILIGKQGFMSWLQSDEQEQQK